MIKRHRELGRSRSTEASTKPLAFHGAVWLGTSLAALGWAFLIVHVLLGSPGRATLSHLWLVELGENLLLSGIALVIVALLIDKSNLQQMIPDRPAPKLAAPNPPAVPPAQRTAPQPPLLVVGRGQVDERGFLVLSDGSVILETLLGQRRFGTLAGAQEFIGPGAFRLTDTVQIPLRSTGRIEHQRSSNSLSLAVASHSH